ncbi:hypothetical protein Tco_1090131, partial [Tanacetum coccineum]
MDLEQNNSLAKLPLLKQGEYDTWRLRIESCIQLQDYSLWEIIEEGNSFKPVAQTTREADGTSTTTIHGVVTLEEKILKKQDLKSRSILMMTLPIWRNKTDLDKMSLDDLCDNFKIIEQEVKSTSDSAASLSDPTVYAFIGNKTKGSQIAHK